VQQTIETSGPYKFLQILLLGPNIPPGIHFFELLQSTSFDYKRPSARFISE